MLASFLLLNCLIAQQNQFIDILNYRGTFKVSGVSGNPYKLLTECFFYKTLTNEIAYGETRISNHEFKFYLFNPKSKTITPRNLDMSRVSTNIQKSELDDIKFYGFSKLSKFGSHTILSIGDNNLYCFKDSADQLIFEKKISISDRIDFNSSFAISDTSLILLDYKATFSGDAKIRAYLCDVKSEKTIQIFDELMGSNSACYDKTNTQLYDFNKNNFIITDNLEYKIYLFNKQGKNVGSYQRDLNVSAERKKMLNPANLSKVVTQDTISKYLSLTPRIYNAQFVNDSDIIVNYSTKPPIVKQGVKFRNSMIDVLTVRDNQIVFKKTLSDEFVYETTDKTGVISLSEVNPSIRTAMFSIFQNGFLINFTFDHANPKSKTSFEKYIKRAKGAILNLKSDFIYNLYEVQL